MIGVIRTYPIIINELIKWTEWERAIKIQEFLSKDDGNFQTEMELRRIDSTLKHFYMIKHIAEEQKGADYEDA